MELLYAIPLGLTLSFAAGPIFFVLIETSINKGRTKALLLDLGAVTADAIFIALAYYGSQAFLSYLQNNFWLVLLSGLAIVAFGVYYVLRSRRSGQLQQKLEIHRRRFFFVKGFLLNFLNVGVLFFWITSTVAVGSLVDNDPRRLLIFYGATLATYLLINLLKIYFAHRFKAYLAGRRMQVIEKLMGLGLIGFGVFIVVRHFL
jgi:threonine/homoserine/homoserine lactone efflux protein